MTLTQEQLEWIVSEVVRRLREMPAAAASSPPAVSSALRLTERLVTLETVRDRLGGVTQVSVPGNAIVTPAVVDLLKEQKVQLIRGVL